MHWSRHAQTAARWLPLAAALLFAGLVIHELCHAAMTLALGGEVLEMRVTPTISRAGLELGRVRHDGVASPRLVAAAPTLLWLVVVSVGALAAARLGSPRKRLAAFGLLVMLPLLDLSASFAGVLLGRRGADLSIALAGHEALANPLFALVVIGCGLVGYRLVAECAPGRLSAGQFAAAFATLLAVPWLLWL